MAHIHLIDKRFHIYRVTDTRPYRQIWAGEVRRAGFYCCWADVA